MDKELTGRQKLFIEEYLTDLNATQAAIRAGYSQKTAYQIGSRLLMNVEISKAISKAQKVTIEKIQISKEDLINDLIRIKNLCLNDARVTHNSIKAIETISKMLGYNEAKKIDITSGGESLIWNETKSYDKK